MRWRVKQQALQGRVDLALRTAWWIAQEHWFEWRAGIRSGDYRPVADEIADTSDCHEYEAIGYAALHRILDRVGPRSPMEREVLLDAGCGMGRVVVEAARRPYSQVLGFDFSPSLIDAARANLEAARPRLRCAQVSVDPGDAADYVVSDAVTTIFIFNAFRGGVMTRFMASVRASVQRRQRRLRIVFSNPRHFDPADFPWLRLVAETSDYHPRMGASNGYRLRTLFLEASSPEGMGR